jgi:glyoxylate/hydroxypyruvate/2-ketogluconate reductase
MARIFVPQPIPEVAEERLRKCGSVTIYPHLDRQIPREELLQGVRDKEILYAIGEIEFDEEVIAAANALKLISAMHGSAPFVDKAAATRRGVPVSSLPYGINIKTTAEFTFGLLMATAWRFPEADRFLREGRWQQNQSQALLGTRLFGKTLGIVGMGTIGQMVARRAAACDMRIVYNKRTRLSPADEMVLGGAEYRELHDLFAQSDFIVLTPKLTRETKGLIDARLIDRMKPSAILINTSRGAVIDEAALEKALVEGRIRGAGLDVYETEVPMPNPGPRAGLRNLPNVVFTPHIGSGARETREEMALRAVRNIETFLAGERPHPVLNPEVYGNAPIQDDRIG